ncbi:hypothetical protein ACFPVX_02450 [Cohnella faecalis]|uniref:Uncharacterized protein n=1 Tax=Cohnella faecalis TaxID=2315694 RepID=A0A398CWC4_9BACL|nr:hypothetical protein [Cohnella faecalis]RIE04858.1 hypothetical protein D3H35_05180 [Cohnella faecalis]
MSAVGYATIWAILLLFPALAAWRRKWWPVALYVIGLLIFLYSVLQDNTGWDDLADFAMLIIVVAPLYVIATVVWVLQLIWRKTRDS